MMATNREQLHAFFEQHKDFILGDVLPFLAVFTSSELSCVSTLYGPQDVLREFLTFIGYYAQDGESVGYDFDSAGEAHGLAATIFAEILLWAFPILLTVNFNAILRAMPVPTAMKYFKNLWAEGLSREWGLAALFLTPGVMSAAGDTLNNVWLSQKLRDEWSPIAIYGQAALSLVFLSLLNFYFTFRAYNWLRYSFGSGNLKLTATQFKIFSYHLGKFQPEEQLGILQSMYQDAGLNGAGAPRTYDELKRNFAGKNCEAFKREVATISERRNLRDGNSKGSTVMTVLTASLSAGSAATTGLTPYQAYRKELEFPVWAAGLITGNGVGVKFLVYWLSYDSLLLMIKHWNTLFGASPIKWGIATVLAALSAIGFLEIAQNGVDAAFPSMLESLPWCYWILVDALFFAGPATNLNGFYLTALGVLQKWKKWSPDYSPDLATGFAELAEEILAMPLTKKVRSDEEEALFSDDGHINVLMQDLNSEGKRKEWDGEVVEDSLPPAPSPSGWRSWLPSLPPLSGCCCSQSFFYNSGEPSSRRFIPNTLLGPLKHIVPNF